MNDQDQEANCAKKAAAAPAQSKLQGLKKKNVCSCSLEINDLLIMKSCTGNIKTKRGSSSILRVRFFPLALKDNLRATILS